MRDRLERPLLARRLSACADRELEGEDPDDPVDQPAGDEAGPGEQLERIAPRDLLAAAAGLPELRLAAHRRTDNGARAEHRSAGLRLGPVQEPGMKALEAEQIVVHSPLSSFLPSRSSIAFCTRASVAWPVSARCCNTMQVIQLFAHSGADATIAAFDIRHRRRGAFGKLDLRRDVVAQDV